MIRLTVELLPGGNHLRARKLGVIEIENTGGSDEAGDYEVTVIDQTSSRPAFTYVVRGVLRGVWYRTVAACLNLLKQTS